MNIEEHITKKSNLETGDSISEFMRHSAQQNFGAFRVFYDFLKEVRPTRILEIGTALGGFTESLKIMCNELELDTNIRSYDISAKPWFPDLIAFGIDIRIENIFNFVDGTMHDEVIEYIQQPGITVVLCDGGNKKFEFNLISNYIKPGDFIMGHDYAETKEIFDEKINKKIWNWLELKYSDIKDACERNNLESYNKETFENVVWVNKRKRNE